MIFPTQPTLDMPSSPNNQILSLHIHTSTPPPYIHMIGQMLRTIFVLLAVLVALAAAETTTPILMFASQQYVFVFFLPIKYQPR